MEAIDVPAFPMHRCSGPAVVRYSDRDTVPTLLAGVAEDIYFRTADASANEDRAKVHIPVASTKVERKPAKSLVAMVDLNHRRGSVLGP